jgi:hypothetical protein
MVRSNSVTRQNNLFTLDRITGHIKTSSINQIKAYVLRTGGATVLRSAAKAGRYVVGMDGFSATASDGLSDKFGAFIDVINKTAGLLDGDGFGIWLDGDGHIYFDVIITFDDRREAIEYAKAGNEIAIYDRKEETEIKV